MTTSSCAGRISVFLEGEKSALREGVGGWEREKEGEGEGGWEREKEGSGRWEREKEGSSEWERGREGEGEGEEQRKMQGEGEREKEGRRDRERGRGRERERAVPGGKGRGGRWLFVSHDPLDEGDLKEKEGGWERVLGVEDGRAGKVGKKNNIDDNGDGCGSKLDVRRSRFVRFQFEPMVSPIHSTPLHSTPFQFNSNGDNK